jgi:hypothetical protein
MTEKRNQRELLWFQAGGALKFITTAPHCWEGNKNYSSYWQLDIGITQKPISNEQDKVHYKN